MDFKPMGGFPPIKKRNLQVPAKKLDTRGFVSSNIVNIGNILNSTKKEDFISFNDETEDGISGIIDKIYTSPNEYSVIEEDF